MVYSLIVGGQLKARWSWAEGQGFESLAFLHEYQLTFACLNDPVCLGCLIDVRNLVHSKLLTSEQRKNELHCEIICRLGRSLICEEDSIALFFDGPIPASFSFILCFLYHAIDKSTDYFICRRWD